MQTEKTQVNDENIFTSFTMHTQHLEKKKKNVPKHRNAVRMEMSYETTEKHKKVTPIIAGMFITLSDSMKCMLFCNLSLLCSV